MGRIKMRFLKNEELKNLEKIVRSEKFALSSNSLHVSYLLDAIDEIDTYFTAEKNGSGPITADDTDLILQENIDHKVLENKEENLQDVVSSAIYDVMQELREMGQND